jgi:hypothetical protein
LKVAELPQSAMTYFDHLCKNIDNCLGEYTEKIKADLDTVSVEASKFSECIETLGVFVPPLPPSNNANILLCPERIKSAANPYSQNDDQAIYEFFYTAIEMHEYAHASMCPQLNDMIDYAHKLMSSLNDNRKQIVAFYTFIEESLATAAMLIKMKDHPLYAQLVSFVSSQPLQYQYGIVLMQKFTKAEIARLMRIWKNAKSTVLWNSALNSFMECLTGEDTIANIKVLKRIDADILSIRNLAIPDIVLLKLKPADINNTKIFQALVWLYRD